MLALRSQGGHTWLWRCYGMHHQELWHRTSQSDAQYTNQSLINCLDVTLIPHRYAPTVSHEPE
jgi:hypothetical protein